MKKLTVLMFSLLMLGFPITCFNQQDWVQIGFDLDGKNPGDNSGKSVCINNAGNKVFIGAPVSSS
jgi:hypothetical protein